MMHQRCNALELCSLATEGTQELYEFMEQREQTKLACSLPNCDKNGQGQFLEQLKIREIRAIRGRKILAKPELVNIKYHERACFYLFYH